MPRIHTISDANCALKLIQENISINSSLIGSFGKGSIASTHDIDILIPDKKFNNNLKDKLFNLLNASGVEDTDWGGWYFHNTLFGDIDIFPSTEDFDY